VASGRRKGKKNRLDRAWRELRESVVRRDGHKCGMCGTAEDLAVHHIIPHRISGQDNEEDLITLCRRCHPFAEKQVHSLVPWDEGYNEDVIRRVFAYHAALVQVGWRLVVVEVRRRGKAYVVHKPRRQDESQRLFFCTPGLHFLEQEGVEGHEEGPVEEVPDECFLPVPPSGSG
jgi:HNH endonuclease